MKKYCIFLFSLINFICAIFVADYFAYNKLSKEIDVCLAKAETTTYAKAVVGCVLYKSVSMNDELNNIYFTVPESYFVTVLQNVSDNVMKVQYDKYIGYVHSSTVIVATFLPIVKTLDGITCDIKETVGTQVWSVPSATDGTSLTIIPAGTKGIKYIAMTYGTIPTGGESNLWYYVNYTPISGSTDVYEGYVYSENVTNLSEIVVNAETNPEVITNEPADNNGTIFVSSPIKTLIIAIIAIPIILLAAILIYKIVIRSKESFAKRKNIRQEVSEAFESENYGGSYIHDDESYSHDDFSLKNRIGEMKHTTFIKKQNRFDDFQKHKKYSYPEFPTYDSEDDML